jgi:YD repeat-containing protein
MSLSGFDAAGEWLRGNLHCHSTLSDGHRTPAEVARAYSAAGYDFLAITDHYEERWDWSITEPSDVDTDLVLLRGAELSSSDWSDADVFWVVAVGLNAPLQRSANGEQPSAVIEAAHRSGAFIGLVHPRLSDVSEHQALGLTHLHAIEIYDQGSVYFDNRPDGWATCEALLAAGRRISAFAADDNHFDQPWEGFQAWVEVRAERDPESIVEALKVGDYYSTQGPLIHSIETSPQAITLRFDPARAVIAQTRDWRLTRKEVGNGITSATFNTAAFAGDYVRFTIIDDNGLRAWSNPHWL